MPVNTNLIHVGSGTLLIDDGLAGEVTIEATDEGGALAYSQALEYIEIDEAIGAVEAYSFVDMIRMTGMRQAGPEFPG